MDKDSSAALHERVAAAMNREKTARSTTIFDEVTAKRVNDNTSPFLPSFFLLLLDESSSRSASAFIAFSIPPHCCGLDRCAGQLHWLSSETRLSGGAGGISAESSNFWNNRGCSENSVYDLYIGVLSRY